MCEVWLFRHERKTFLHRLIIGDKNWINFKNSNRRKSWVDPGQPSTSTIRPNCFGKKTMLCIRWDYKGVVYHEFLEPGKTVNTVRYREQMINLYHALIKNVTRRVCKTRKSDFAIRQRPIWHSKSNQTTFLHLSGNSCLARRTRQTWALPTTTWFHWCLTHISWNSISTWILIFTSDNVGKQWWR